MNPPNSSRKREGDLDRKFLQEVLQKALVAPHPAESVISADLEALREVARNHRGKPFGLEPISVELVRAALKSYFSSRRDGIPSRKGSGDFWDAISREIARSLYDDPVFQERLRALWIRLGEAV